MQRISKLKLKNFKYFYGDQELNFDRKNILLYGENGSGKSSIYWGLYTFLQSVFKTEDSEIKKYFDIRNEQNLVNRFTENGAESSIIVEFQKDDKTVTTKEISLNVINTKSENLVKEASITSDFINYRILSSIYSFSHRDYIDLFPTFEEDILMFITFTTEFNPGNRNASDWWTFIEPGMQPRTKMNDAQYRDFQAKVVGFNTEFDNYLKKIIETANEYIQQKFKLQLKLKLEYVPCSYDAFIDGSTTRRNHSTIRPKILLTVDYTHDKLIAGREVIKRPHSFLNEARLTSIALSIRLAILDEKYIEAAPKLLVLDDLLISLDMSNRDIVLDLILSEFKEYQIIIMSHDRMYFELAKHKIKALKNDDWKYIEMYEAIKNGIPQPFITSSENYLEKAKKFFVMKEYEVAGNFLRKEAESFCKDFLPKRRLLNPDFTLHNLDGLINQSLQYAIENGLITTLFTDLHSHRKFVLNSTSHDSYDVPKFNSEISRCIETLEDLRKINYKIVLKKGDKLDFELVTADGVDTYKFEIIFQEEVKLIKQGTSDSILPKAMINYMIYKNTVKMHAETQHGINSIKKMYDDNYVSSDKNKSSDFWEEVVVSETGQKLKEIRVF